MTVPRPAWVRMGLSLLARVGRTVVWAARICRRRVVIQLLLRVGILLGRASMNGSSWMRRSGVFIARIPGSADHGPGGAVMMPLAAFYSTYGFAFASGKGKGGPNWIIFRRVRRLIDLRVSALGQGSWLHSRAF